MFIPGMFGFLGAVIGTIIKYSECEHNVLCFSYDSRICKAKCTKCESILIAKWEKA